MATTLYLIRHGSTAGDEEMRYKGSIDVPLSDKGRGQIARASLTLERLLARRARANNNSSGLAAVYSSPLSRARETAGIVALPFGLEPVIIPAFRERCFGRWEGLTFDEIARRYPEEFSAWVEDPLDSSPQGGESTREVAARLEPALENILARHENENIVIAAHGGVNRVILCLFLGIPLTNIFRLEQDHGAINIVEFHQRYPVIKGLNLVSWEDYG